MAITKAEKSLKTPEHTCAQGLLIIA